MSRPVYVYELEVHVPKDSDPGNPHRWPRNRRYLTLGGAVARARLFEEQGASVIIHRSKPVEWDNTDKTSMPFRQPRRMAYDKIAAELDDLIGEFSN